MKLEHVKTVLAGIASLGIGVGCLVIGSGMSAAKEGMTGWSSTECVINSSDSVPKAGGRRGLTSGWGPSVSYRYVVGEQEYTSDRLTAGGRYWSSNRGEVNEWLAPYRTGAIVTVYYDPADPSESVLDRSDYGHSDVGAKAVGWFFVGIAALGFTGIGVRAYRGELG